MPKSYYALLVKTKPYFYNGYVLPSLLGTFVEKILFCRVSAWRYPWTWEELLCIQNDQGMFREDKL